ncbi:tRNA uridine-5-carboxymethylaminomethyl(34) synthesis GTPase MnmE [bacterium]|nr:tRNA uridine-5-carboxymethylaminomethyl(34) synthesis GTPase MnmE [bacterium]
MIFDDTIAAIATPIGIGGISVIRISGNNAITVADKLFSSSVSLKNVNSHTLHYGKLVDPVSNEAIDQVLISVMREPKTYTGLDTVEVNCHGGILNTQKILDLILRNGARLAEPGEFTKIAFLNGKLDLSQVEAIGDLIHAKTEGARRSSAAQFMGNLSSEIKILREGLINLCSLLELDLDFAEENLLDIKSDPVIKKIEFVEFKILDLLSTYNFGQIVRNGAKVAIIGKPNVGKSSLLNSLLLRNRALVSDIPGTTRDYIEETIDIDGIPFTLIDTAGLRHSEDTVETAGIELTNEILENSDLILLMFDASSELDGNDFSIIKRLKEESTKYKKLHIVFIANKIDRPQISTSHLREVTDSKIIEISAKEKIGIQDLKKHIAKIFSNNLGFNSPVISRQRHKIALEKSLESIQLAKETIKNKMSFEFASIDVHNAISHLGEIVGEIKGNEVLNNIFSNFCIGK